VRHQPVGGVAEDGKIGRSSALPVTLRAASSARPPYVDTSLPTSRMFLVG
jgi:hypothetical protein